MPNVSTDIKQQLAARLSAVIKKEIERLQVCGASDCNRLYVKTYRREFCSTQCQKRTHMRAYRKTLG